MTSMQTVDRPAAELVAIPADFGFTGDHELAAKEARRFLAERCPLGSVRRVVDARADHDPALWRDIAGLGWVGLGWPEAWGGAALDRLHLALLLEEMGRALLPSPFVACQLALEALAVAGSEDQQLRWCPDIIAGERIASFASSEPGGYSEPGQILTRAVPAEAGFALHGDKSHVLAGASADLVVVPARSSAGPIELFVVELPHPGVRVEREVCVDATRPTARLSFDGARVPAAARLARGGQAALATVLARGAAMLAAEMVGAAEAVLVMTRDYAAERQQFGRAIGSFQAVKHPIVDMMCGVELARSLSLAAAAAIDHDPASAERAARMAKAYAGDALSFAVKKGVQLHGGFGFTWDCNVHLYFKRALWSRATLGDAAHHRRHLATLLLG